MSRVLAQVAGKILTLLGYDGTDFRNLLVDDTGALQVDVLTTAINALAATEATLATRASEAKLELVRLLLASLDGKDFATQATLAALLTELEGKADLSETQPISAAALPLPAGASTSAKQDTMITALQLIDDLRNALDSVGTDELDVNVESSVLPAGAATAARQDLLKGRLDDILSELAVGGKYKGTLTSKKCTSGSWTDLTDMSVHGGRIHYITGFIVSSLTAAVNFELRIYKNAAVHFHMLVESNPVTAPPGWYITQTAGNSWKFAVLQTSGSDVWMNSMVQYIDVAA